MRRRPATVALVVWTFLVWTTRISNIWRDDGLSRGDQVGRTAVALTFTVLAAAVLGALWRAGSAAPGRARLLRLTVGALAAWTVPYWVVRDLGIATADHDAAFVAVHVVLGVVSVILAVLAWREVRGDAAPATRDPAQLSSAG